MSNKKAVLTGILSVIILIVMSIGLIYTISDGDETHKMTGVGLLSGGSVLILILMFFQYMANDVKATTFELV